MKRLAIVCVAACCAMAAFGAATASAAETSSHSFAGQGSTDSGTCGNDWATDTYTRQFKTYTNQSIDGSYRLVENFKAGHFTTMQGASPESCQANNSHLVSSGINGSFHGSYILQVSGGTYNNANAAAWDETGGTAGYVATAFGGSATFTTEDFYFYYHTNNGLACANTWTNASTGNGGDIATIC